VKNNNKNTESMQYEKIVKKKYGNIGNRFSTTIRTYQE